MAKNPFIGPKAPWIEIHGQTDCIHKWINNNAFKLIPCGPVKCIYRCKDPAKAAYKIANSVIDRLSIKIGGWNYGEFIHQTENIKMRENQAYDHLIFCLELHKAFYDEQEPIHWT